MEQVDVGAEVEDEGTFLLKIQRPDVEVNVRGFAVELEQLSELSSADWNSRRSIQAGGCLGSVAWWCSDSRTVSLLVGPDDEAWDFAIELPLDIGDLIVAAIRAELVNLANRLMKAEYRSEVDLDRAVEVFDRALPHPQASDLIFWPSKVEGFDEPHTAERIVDFGLSHGPIAL